MKTNHYPNKITSHLVTNVPMTSFTLKSTSKGSFRVKSPKKKMKFETVPPQILMKIYTFDLYGQKRRFAK